VIDPGRLTPREWAESDARRKERRADLANPYGRPMPRAARIVVAWLLSVALAAVVVVTILGLSGVLDVFPSP
jgi:hypothetical protein